MEHKQNQILGFRGIAYVLLILALAFFSDYIIIEGASFTLAQIFDALALVALGQLIAIFVRMNEWGILAFFLADALIAMILVQSTGASASPFLVLYPLVALAGSVIFSQSYLPWILVSALLAMMALSVGWGVAILGNALAILVTSGLGFYLAKALKISGIQLEKSEGARRRLENLQKAILTNIPSGLLSVDADGRIIQVNRVALNILEKSESHIINRGLAEVLPGLSEEILRLNTLHPASNFLESPQDRKTVDYHRDTGEVLKLGYSVARLSDPIDRSVLGTLVVFQDLTVVMKLEESLRISEKLAAVGKLAAGIAHEIRNPLAGISGSAQLLLGSSDLDEEDKKLLSIIQRESVRLDGLITEFLEYVRPQRPKLENLSLTALTQQAIENMKVSPKWQKLKSEISFHQKEGMDVRVKGDANKITQILLNFLYNAGQAGATSVRVEVEAGVRPSIKIIDNGSGISANNQKRLFEPFFTTKEGGTGLGLAISYRIIESMNGTVKVVSPLHANQSNGGTMFSIDFEGVSS